MKRFYDTKQQADPDYKPGDKVNLSGANLVTHRLTKKFKAQCYGPFMVVCKVGAISYELKLPKFIWSSTPYSFIPGLYL
jgi:hypothetical protein